MHSSVIVRSCTYLKLLDLGLMKGESGECRPSSSRLEWQSLVPKTLYSLPSSSCVGWNGNWCKRSWEEYWDWNEEKKMVNVLSCNKCLVCYIWVKNKRNKQKQIVIKNNSLGKTHWFLKVFISVMYFKVEEYIHTTWLSVVPYLSQANIHGIKPPKQIMRYVF